MHHLNNFKSLYWSQTLRGIKIGTRCFKSVSSSPPEELVKVDVKEPLITRWKSYWKALYRDYKEVAGDVHSSIKAKPIKSIFGASIIGSLYYCGVTNPDEIVFRNTLLSYSNKMSFINPKIRNKSAEDHLIFIESMSNAGLIRRLSLGLFSFIWIDNYSSDSCVFKATCTYLKPELLSFHERIIDIGFLGHWWILENRMEDYDINPDEWRGSH